MTEKARNIEIFTKSDIKPIILIIGFSLLFSWVIAPLIRKDYSLGNYVSLYTLSALIQAFAALFALIGMFIIFKLQLIDNRISSTERQIVDYFRSVIGKVPAYGTVYDLRNDIRKTLPHVDRLTNGTHRFLLEDGAWIKRFDELEELEK